MGSHGITLNKEKFKLYQKEVNYMGFRITEDGVEPGKVMLEAGMDFPRPKDLSGVVKQVKKRIHSFNVGRTTCLRADYSQDGIEFLLLQKYCKSSSISPRCCLPG